MKKGPDFISLPPQYEIISYGPGCLNVLINRGYIILYLQYYPRWPSLVGQVWFVYIYIQ